MNEIDAYCQSVVDGTVLAGKYHRLACERHLRDRAREGTADFPFVFKFKLAQDFFDFAQLLKHYKGKKWAGDPIVLQPHQKFRLGSLFGWVGMDGSSHAGLRRFRTAYNEIPRKNGKTLEAALVMLYLTFFDGEPGAEGYTIATKRDQAKLVFNDAKQLVKSSDLKSYIKVQVASLRRESRAAKLEPLGADHDSTDGLNPNAVCADELHAYKDRGLLDVMETATGARTQPVFFKITTAGDDPVSPGGDEHDYACKVLSGALNPQDETYFAFIASADEGDDWLDERTWEKANPNWNVSVQPDEMRALARKAANMPEAAASFKQKRLNLWVNSAAPCLSMEGWRKGQSDWTAEDMEGEPCYIGVDLASQIDLCALSVVFPPSGERQTWRLLQHIWTPNGTLHDRAHRDRAPYEIWRDGGWMVAVPGDILDHDIVRQKVRELAKRYDVRLVGIDPGHGGQQLAVRLVEQDGFTPETVLTVGQGFKSGFHDACEKMREEVLVGRVDARHCPVTAWAASNVVPKYGEKNDILFSKRRSRGRIDPIMSATIAMALTIQPAQSKPEPDFSKSLYIVGAQQR